MAKKTSKSVSPASDFDAYHRQLHQRMMGGGKPMMQGKNMKPSMMQGKAGKKSK